jgi:hypothetical protein
VDWLRNDSQLVTVKRKIELNAEESNDQNVITC